MRAITFIITSFFSVMHLIPYPCQPHFIVSADQSHNHSSSASVVRNTREYLAQQLRAGRNIYGDFEPTHAQPLDHIEQSTQRMLRILQQQEAKKTQIMKLYRDRCDIVHTIFDSQRPHIEAQLTTWQQHHPDRVNAYYRTLVPLTGRARYDQQHHYTLSRDADKFLRTYNIDPHKYIYGNGNVFQHELMQEIVAGIHHSASVELPPQDRNPFAHTIMHHTVHAFDDALATNSMGDCVTSIKLIDIAHTLLDYCKKVSSGAIDITLTSMKYGTSIAKGISYAVRDAVTNTINFAIHPLEGLNHILQLPFVLGELINAYAPGIPDIETATNEEWDAYFKQLKVAQENCRQLKEHIAHFWQTTPSEEILQQVTYIIASIRINAFIANRITSFAGDAIRYAKSTIAKTAAQFRARKIPRLSGPIYIDAEAVFIPSGENSMYMLQPTPVPVSPVTPSIVNMGVSIGIPQETIVKALENLVAIPDIEGCPHILKRCFEELAHLPGFAALMGKTLRECAIGDPARGKGGFNELRSALLLKDEGHSVLELEWRVIKKYKSDIITDQYLVECKNWDFESLAKYPIKLEAQDARLMKQLSQALEAAQEVNKKVLLMSKKAVPIEIANKIRAMGVEIREG